MLESARGNGRVEELVLADGARIACDAVVVGVGVGARRPAGSAAPACETGVPHRRRRPHRAPGRLRRRRRRGAVRPPPRRPHRAPSTGMPPPGRAPPPRERCSATIRRAAAAELLERPVRHPDPVRRPRRHRRRRLHRGRPVGARLRRRLHPRAASRSPRWPSAGRARFAELRKQIELTTQTRQEHGKEGSMSYIPTIDPNALQRPWRLRRHRARGLRARARPRS